MKSQTLSRIKGWQGADTQMGVLFRLSAAEATLLMSIWALKVVLSTCAYWLLQMRQRVQSCRNPWLRACAVYVAFMGRRVRRLTLSRTELLAALDSLSSSRGLGRGPASPDVLVQGDGWRAQSRHPSWRACRIFLCSQGVASITLDMTNLCSNPRKFSSQSYAPYRDLLPLEHWSSVCPRRGLQPRQETC